MFIYLIRKLSKMVITRGIKQDDDGSRKRRDTSLEKKLKTIKAKKVNGSSSKPAYPLEDEDISLNSIKKEENPSTFHVEVEMQTKIWYMTQLVLGLI